MVSWIVQLPNKRDKRLEKAINDNLRYCEYKVYQSSVTPYVSVYKKIVSNLKICRPAELCCIELNLGELLQQEWMMLDWGCVHESIARIVLEPICWFEDLFVILQPFPCFYESGPDQNFTVHMNFSACYLASDAAHLNIYNMLHHSQARQTWLPGQVDEGPLGKLGRSRKVHQRPSICVAS